MKKKSIKITFFNPITLKKRVYRFVAEWDSINHCWDLSLSREDLNPEEINSMSVHWDYNITINHFIECYKYPNEYVTIKTVQ